MTTPSDIVGFPAQLQETANVLAIIAAATGITLTGGNIIPAIPSADPHVVGALWNDAGTVNVSAG